MSPAELTKQAIENMENLLCLTFPHSLNRTELIST